MSPDMWLLTEAVRWIIAHPKTTALLFLALVLIEGVLVVSGIWRPER